MTGGTSSIPTISRAILAESIAGEATLETFVLEGALPPRRRRMALAALDLAAALGPGRRACRLHRRRPRHHRVEAEAAEAARGPGRRAHRRPARRARPAAGRGRRARAGRGGASPGAEDGGGRPAHRRHRPRFQQSADPGDRRARDHRPLARGAAAEADRRGGARIGPARRQADLAVARFLAHPADPHGAGPGQPGDRDDAADAPAHDRRRDHGPHRARPGGGPRSVRREPARKRDPQPRDQRPRRDAGGRHADHLDRPRARARRHRPRRRRLCLRSPSPTPARA